MQAASRTHRPLGFTLIEALLYLAIGAVMCAFLGSITSHILIARLKAHALSEARYIGQFAIERMTHAAHDARSVTRPALGEAGSALGFEDEEGLETEFYAEDDILMIRIGDAAYPLSSDAWTAELVAARSAWASSGSARITLTLTPRPGGGLPQIPPQTFVTSIMTYTP